MDWQQRRRNRRHGLWRVVTFELREEDSKERMIELKTRKYCVCYSLFCVMRLSESSCDLGGWRSMNVYLKL